MLQGSYGYSYTGTSYTPDGVMSLAQTGVFTVDASSHFSARATLAGQFPTFRNQGPLWLLMHEVSQGVVTSDTDNPYTGTVTYTATVTIITTSDSNLVPEGTVIEVNTSRSSVYTISGPNQETVEIISTSPGTIATGTAHKLA